MRATLTSLLLLLVTAALLAGCGDSDDGASDDARSTDTTTETETTDDAPATEHIDGTVTVEGDSLVVTPNGRAPITMSLDDGVELAEVRALQAAGANARVTFTPATGDEASSVAVDVRATPKHEGQQTYTGKIVKVDEESITIAGADGEKTYAMGIKDEHEIEHLGEHRDGGEPVTVFLADAGSDAGETVVAYEDA